ncbi:MAG: hypothetical protein CL609_12015 [Anaerolineaceae bacterium]|nr:hypothetical protein [Anaerolineaceae bacterium]
MPNHQKVTIIGGSIWGNRGAAAMLETTIGKIRESSSNVEFFIFTPYPSVDKSLTMDTTFTFFDSRPKSLILLNIKAVWFWFLKKIRLQIHPSGELKAIIESRQLLDIGGITFSDGRLIFLPYNILTILPALLFNVPVIKLSQAAGPFHNPIIRIFAKIFLSKCTFIFARGEKTLEFLSGLGLDKNQVSLAMDATFVFDEKYCLTKENTIAVNQVCESLDIRKKEGTRLIGISPSILVKDKMQSKNSNYLKILIETIKKSSYQQDLHFLVFPNASREKSKKKRNNDILVIEEMRNLAEIDLPKSIYDRITWMPFDIDTRGIGELVKRLDILISSRFHAMVFGLRLGIPTLVIGWGHKYLEVMKVFHQESCVFDYQETGRDLVKLIHEMLEKNEKIRSEISQELLTVQALSQKQFDYLKRFLD